MLCVDVNLHKTAMHANAVLPACQKQTVWHNCRQLFLSVIVQRYLWSNILQPVHQSNVVSVTIKRATAGAHVNVVYVHDRCVYAAIKSALNCSINRSKRFCSASSCCMWLKSRVGLTCTLLRTQIGLFII